MADYAVLFYFDSESEKTIRKIQEAICCSSRNTYLSDNGIRPHITLSLFSRDDSEDLTAGLALFAAQLADIDIKLTSIGIFNTQPSVINLLPVVSEDLIRMHTDLREKLSHFVTDFHPYYVRENWVPHCAVAISINTDEFAKAVETACALFQPLTCRISALSLVECSPYRTVMDWTVSST